MQAAFNSGAQVLDWPEPRAFKFPGNGSNASGRTTLGYVLDSIQDGYYEVNLRGDFRRFNRAMREMIGYREHELKGMNYKAYMDPADAARVFKVFNEVFLTGRPSKAFDWKINRKDGSLRYIETSVSLKRGQHGAPLGFFGIARDVTDLKRAREELVKAHDDLHLAHERLKSIEELKAKAVHRLSHELKTPVAILDGVLQLLVKKLAAQEDPQILRSIERGQRCLKRLNTIQIQMDDIVRYSDPCLSLRLSRLLEDLRWIKDGLQEDGLPPEKLFRHLVEKLEAIYGHPPEALESIDLGEALRAQVEKAKPYCDARRINVKQQIAGSIAIRLNRAILAKVVEGLLRNAIENTPDGGQIVIRGREGRSGIYAEIIDFGVGISRENQPHLFWGFFHAQDTPYYTTRRPYAFNAGGSGADLLRMKIFAERLGFSLACQSRRCRHLSGEDQACPGEVSACGFIRSPRECLKSGGSRFVVMFPRPGAADQPPSS